MLRRLAIIGALFCGIGELSQTNPTHLEHSPSAAHPQSINDLLYVIRSEVGDIIMNERFALPDDPDLPPDPGFAPVAMGKTALSKAWATCQRLWANPSGTAGEISDNVQTSARYLRDYRLSENQASRSDPATLDCNDRANITCERLDRLGLPMHLLSIWPEDPTMRFDEGWHQMSACKLRGNCFLIFDDKHTTLWHGSLASFALQYGPKIRMRVIPHVGISEYIRPKYDCSLAKFLVQATHSVPSEQEMKSLDLPAPGEVIQIASR